MQVDVDRWQFTSSLMGSLPAAYWQLTGSVLAAFGQLIGSLLAAYWQLTGNSRAAYWQITGNSLQLRPSGDRAGPLRGRSHGGAAIGVK